MKKPTIRIDNNIPVPHGREAAEGKLALWRQTVRDMKPRQSFTVKSHNKLHNMNTQKMILKVAKSMGIAVTTRKLNNGSLRVWRLPSK